MSASLAGRRVLVTGANGSLGSATAAALHDRGARVIGLDLVESDDVIACDVRDQADVTAAVARARDVLDGIDSTVHFAGIGFPTSAGEAPGDTVMRTLDVNLLGAWRVTAACIDDLVARRGRLVFVASELAYATIPFATAYSVSKRGLAAYADSVRAEFGSHVGVTTVYPGYIRTPIHDASIAAGLSLETATRPQRAEDVAATVIRALTATRAPRDVACTAMGSFELAAARHLPAVVDAVIRGRLRREASRGTFRSAPLAAAMRGRLGIEDGPTVSACRLGR
jgi:NAD(P)-dependent dehydrogenase (short-subunit alcohol dehydrogenase family)